MKKSIKSKLVVFALLLGLAVIGAVCYPVSAGAFDSDSVIVDYVNETVTVLTDTDEIVYFTDVYNKDVAKWDACDVRNGKASFDISWVISNKTVRLYLCGDVNKEVVSVDIIWEEDFSVEFVGSLLTTDITEAKEWKAVYENYENFSEDTGYFIFAIEENGRDMSYFELENIQWRKGDDGVWREFKELDLREMNIRGIGLEFRVVADNNGPARASSTAKISVSKLLSAPVILVNPNTMTLGIKNGMEFSFDKENWIMVPEYNKKFGTEDYLITEDIRENAIEKIYTNQRLSTLIMQEVLKTQDDKFTMNTPMNRENLKDFNANGQVFELTEEGIVLYVREIGTDRKAASKIAEVIIPYAPENMAIAQEGALQFSYGESKTNTGGIVVENTTEFKYQVGVLTPEEWKELGDSQDDINLANMKWTSIKGGKMLKISNKKVPKGSYLVYRIGAEEGQLPSTYRIYGPMEYNELTYAGIAPGKEAAGETLKAVVSTNFEKKNDGTYEGLTFQWQRSANKTAAEEEWENIPGATSPTYKLSNDDSTKYVRVVVTNRVTVGITAKEIKMATDPVGPIAYVTPENEAPQQPEGN